MEPVADNIWVVDGGIVEMDIKMAKMPFSTRMTVVRLSNHYLWCHLPIEPSQELFDELNHIGEVRYFMAPNKIHYAHIDARKKSIPRLRHGWHWGLLSVLRLRKFLY